MKTFSITFALGAVVLLASNVAAHGRFLSPATRIADGDENQGFTQTRSPTTQEPCAGVPFQGVKTQLSPGQTFPYSWEIGAAHRGTCFLELSTDGAKTFQTIKEDPHCADSDGTFNSEATLPAGVTGDQCVIRWRWQALLTGELYINCADVSIGGSGGGTTSGDAGSGGTTSGDAGSGGTTSGSTGSDGTGSDGTGSGGTTSGSTGSDGAGSGAPTVQMPSTGDPSNPSTDPSNPSTDPSNPSTDPSNPSTGDPSTDPSNPSTADPSTTAADPSTTDPSTADPSTADPSTGGDPGCEMQPGQDGGESPSTDDPQQPPADSNTGNTSANSGAKRFRRSAQRAGPRRLRRSA